MSYTRDVRFGKKKRPTREEIGEALRRYVNTSGTVEDKGDMFWVVLVGASKSPFVLCDGDDFRFRPPHGFEERCFEVYYYSGSVSIVSRMRDEYTHAVQAGFARAIARRWRGRFEEDAGSLESHIATLKKALRRLLRGPTAGKLAVIGEALRLTK